MEKLGDYQGAPENYQYSFRVISEARANNRAAIELQRAKAKYTVLVGAAWHQVGDTRRVIEMVKRGLDLERDYIAEDKNRFSTAF